MTYQIIYIFAMVIAISLSVIVGLCFYKYLRKIWGYKDKERNK